VDESVPRHVHIRGRLGGREEGGSGRLAPVVTLADDSPKRYRVCHGDAWDGAQGTSKNKTGNLRPLPLPYPFQDNQQIGIFLIHLPYRK